MMQHMGTKLHHNKKNIPGKDIACANQWISIRYMDSRLPAGRAYSPLCTLLFWLLSLHLSEVSSELSLTMAVHQD